MRKLKDQDDKKIQNIENDLNNIKNDINEIKTLLRNLAK
jgi:archaellum component FlaC